MDACPDLGAVSTPAQAQVRQGLAGQEEAIDQLAELIKAQLSAQLFSTALGVDTIHTRLRQNREDEVALMVTSLKTKIDELQRGLAVEIESKARAQQGLLDFQSKASARLDTVRATYSSPVSLQRVFSAWRQASRRSKRTHRIDTALGRQQNTHLLSKYFSALCAAHKQARYEKAMGEANFKYETLNGAIVSRYEADLARLQVELRDAHAVIKREELKRTQLEDEVKRLLLKNMTAMNMEALAIFKSVNGGRGGGGAFGDEPRDNGAVPRDGPVPNPGPDVYTEPVAAPSSPVPPPPPSPVPVPVLPGPTPSPVATSSAHLDKLSEMYRSSLSAVPKPTRSEPAPASDQAPKPRRPFGKST